MPFEGTFNGNGYAISGLNVNCGKNGGLFEVIGKNGTVKDLHVVDCDFISNSSTFAGGIAAVNKGTIDHCTSGVNLSASKKITLPSGKKISVSYYNSILLGTNVGGITALNYGTITGCRNGSSIKGETAAGIAAVNNGTIYGCANNGPIGTDSVTCKIIGGLVGENSGTIEASYNSGKVTGSVNTELAAVAVINHSSDVKNVFYSNSSNVNVFGDQSSVKDDSGCKFVSNTDMMTDAFIGTLNEVTDDSIEWTKATYGNLYFNQGYPTIKSRFHEQRTVNASNGITLRGSMHSSLKTTYTPIPATDEDYAAFEAVYGKGSVRNAYAVSLTDENGNYIPGELWSSGVTMTVPVTSQDDVILALDETGTPVKIDNVVIKDGKATFTAPEAVTFAVVSKSTSDNAQSSTSSVKSPKTSTTGSMNTMFFLELVLMITAAIAVNVLSKAKMKTKKAKSDIR